MRSLRLARAVCAAGIASACALGLAGCGGAASGSGAAATVNGTAVSEESVTSYVQEFRASLSLEDEEAWGQWLAGNGYTPQTIREDVIDYYVDQELLRQAARERGVEADAGEVDKSIEDVKANYGSDEEWLEALEAAGTTEEAYREQAELAQLEEALRASFDEGGEPSDDEVLEAAAAYRGAKRASCILLEPGQAGDAEDVQSRIRNGSLDFAEAARELSADASAENGGDKGWDALGALGPECATALAELGEGEVSEPVETAEGTYLVKCTAVFSVPDDGLTSVDQVPSEILEAVRSDLSSSGRSDAYGDWYADFKAKADIQVNDMPASLPYDLDMSKYRSQDEAPGDGTAPEADAAAPEGVDTAAPAPEEAAAPEAGSEPGDGASAADPDAAPAESGDAADESAKADAA